METNKNYLEINRLAWNLKTDVHLKSKFYGVDAFIKGKSSLNEIELKLLDNVDGKSILHLQCHFGQDSISMARMGADVTGVDLSDKAIEEARKISKKTKYDAEFICSDLYQLPKLLNKQFDIVFSSYGSIGWLPDLFSWAKVVSHFLKPGGKFVFVEFHPVVWMFDKDFKKIEYSYFNLGEISETEKGTYANRSADVTIKTISWNHSLSEVINSLIKNNLEIRLFEEFDFSPYNCFNHTTEPADGKFMLKNLENKIPMIYSLLAVKQTTEKTKKVKDRIL